MDSKNSKSNRLLLRPNNLFGGDNKREPEDCPSRIRSRSQDVVRDTKCDLEAVETRLWNLNGLMTFNDETFQFRKEDFLLLESLGSGACSTVYRAQHRIRRHCVIAVKQMYRSTCQLEENRRIARDLEVITQCHDCPFIVQCYGVLITGLEVWICMEVMTTCLEKLLDTYKKPFPEDIIGVITVCVVKALNYLKTKHQIMHRDLKPSNILLNTDGAVKLCDFGISSRLHCSVALSVEKGCAGYLAPERVDSDYCDVRADVWSLGLTLFQMATLQFPYEGACCFEVLTRITHDPAPRMVPGPGASVDLCHFVNLCLTKDVKLRPKYDLLMQTRFLQSHEVNHNLVSHWYRSITGAASPLPSPSPAPTFTSPHPTVLSADSGCVPSPLSGTDPFSGASRSSSNRSQITCYSIASPGDSCASSTPRDVGDTSSVLLLVDPPSRSTPSHQPLACHLLPSAAYLPYQGSLSAPLPQYRAQLREPPGHLPPCGSDCVSPRHHASSSRPSHYTAPAPAPQQPNLTGQPPMFCFYTSVSPRQQRIQHICTSAPSHPHTSNAGPESSSTPRGSISGAGSGAGGSAHTLLVHAPGHTRTHQHIAYVAATPPANRRYVPAAAPRFSATTTTSSTATVNSSASHKPPLTLTSQRSLPKGH